MPATLIVFSLFSSKLEYITRGILRRVVRKHSLKAVRSSV